MLPETGHLFVNHADASEAQGDFQIDLEQYESAIQLARSKGSVQLGEVLFASAEYLYRTGHYAEAAARCHETLQNKISTQLAAEVHNLIGICTSITLSLDEGEAALTRSADLYRHLGNKAGLGRTLHNLASCVYIPRGKFNLALWSNDEAQAIWADLGVTHWGRHFLRAYIFMIMGNKHQARQELDEIIQVIEPATALAGGYYYLWARLAIDQGAYEQAREYIRLGLRIATQTGMPDLNIWMRIEQSRYYRTTGASSTAHEWAEEAVKISSSLGFLYFEGISLIELALTSWNMGAEKEAFLHLDRAIQALSHLNANYDLAYGFYLLALWQHQIQHPDASGSWCQAASALLEGDYTFILEKEQESAFRLIANHLRSPDPAVCAQSEKLLSSLSHVTPPPLRIKGLGQFRVWKGGQLISERSWLRRKTGELFRFLLLQPNRAASKELILDALWPENPIESGTGLLHQSTSALRRLLEPDLPEKFPSRYLLVEGEQISLILPPGSMIDFEVFNRTLPQAIRSQNAERMQEAMQLYSGDLFPSDRYLDWTTSVRTRLAEIYQEGLLTIAGIHFENHQFADALDAIRQILKQDPWNEDAVLIAMKTYIELGAAPHAIRVYAQLADSLKSELRLSPRSDLQKLSESIRNR